MNTTSQRNPAAVTSAILPLLQQVKSLADGAGVFGPSEIRGEMLVCRAKNAAAPASYRVFMEKGKVWVSLVMADRWLSESIETDLLHTGDKVNELIEEEVMEQGLPATGLPVEHFRSDDLLFTFRSPLPATDAARVSKFLFAYESCFRNLGDMNEAEDD